MVQSLAFGLSFLQRMDMKLVVVMGLPPEMEEEDNTKAETKSSLARTTMVKHCQALTEALQHNSANVMPFFSSEALLQLQHAPDESRFSRHFNPLIMVSPISLTVSVFQQWSLSCRGLGSSAVDSGLQGDSSGLSGGPRCSWPLFCAQSDPGHSSHLAVTAASESHIPEQLRGHPQPKPQGKAKMWIWKKHWKQKALYYLTKCLHYDNNFLFFFSFSHFGMREKMIKIVNYVYLRV